MNKIAIFILVAILFSVVSAVADTTYVCSEVGDWDQWQVSTNDQDSLESQGWIMEVSVDDDSSSCIAYNVNDVEPDLRKIAKDKSQCNTACTVAEVTSNQCPCDFFSTDADHTAAMVQSVVYLLLNAY